MADKIAISLDPELLEQVERLRRRTRESRSAVFARAARMLLAEEDHRRKVRRYVDAYREHPETEAEVATAEALARASLRGVEWDA
jgi:metal-responsive CopG/Arc/MetJ family transcriptional regulator